MSSLRLKFLPIALGLSTAINASAYKPYDGAPYLFKATHPEVCNNYPCILYPKSAQLPSGRIVAAFEDSQSEVVGQTIPIYKSEDKGDMGRSSPVSILLPSCPATPITGFTRATGPIPTSM